jgi:uncharacterized RDD family membrane protein YckC
VIISKQRTFAYFLRKNDQFPIFFKILNIFKMNDQILDYGVNQGAKENPFENLDDASQGKRLLNYIIDLICFYIVAILLMVVLFLPAMEDGSYDEDSPSTTLISYLVAIGVIVGYYTFFEYVCKGRTIGKFITGTRAIMLNGDKLSLRAAFLRSLSRLVPFEPISFLMSRNGWHDRWTDTYVVNEREYQAALSKTEFGDSFFNSILQ